MGERWWLAASGLLHALTLAILTVAGVCGCSRPLSYVFTGKTLTLAPSPGGRKQSPGQRKFDNSMVRRGGSGNSPWGEGHGLAVGTSAWPGRPCEAEKQIGPAYMSVWSIS